MLHGKEWNSSDQEWCTGINLKTLDPSHWLLYVVSDFGLSVISIKYQWAAQCIASVGWAHQSYQRQLQHEFLPGLCNCCLPLSPSFRDSLSSYHPLPQFWRISVAPHPHLPTPGTWCLTLCGPISVLTVLYPNSIPSSPLLISLSARSLFVFPLRTPHEPCTCLCTITLFLLAEGEEVLEMLALVMGFTWLAVSRGSRRQYHDLEGHSEKWLGAAAAAALSMERAVVGMERTAGRELWSDAKCE